jgi:hypothetical protein
MRKDKFRDIQETDALVDQKVHQLENSTHEQDECQDEDDHDKGQRNFSQDVKIEDSSHVTKPSFFIKAKDIREHQARQIGQSAPPENIGGKMPSLRHSADAHIGTIGQA